MHPILKIFVRIAIICAVVFFAIQPYNWYCQLSRSCTSFFLSDLIPKKEGKIPLKLGFFINNFREDIVVTPNITEMETVANRKNTVSFSVRNNSKRIARFKFALYIRPEQFEQYMVRYECLCFHSYVLKPGEATELTMVFALNEKIEKDLENIDYVDFSAGEKIEIGYKVK